MHIVYSALVTKTNVKIATLHWLGYFVERVILAEMSHPTRLGEPVVFNKTSRAIKHIQRTSAKYLRDRKVTPFDGTSLNIEIFPS